MPVCVYYFTGRMAGSVRPHAQGKTRNRKADRPNCLGPVIIDSDNDEEDTLLGWKSGTYPDLLISVYSKALTPDDPQQHLSKRATVADGHMDIHVLRRGTTALGGMKAEEWLAKASNRYNNHILAFSVESIRTDPALERPYVSIDLDAGGQLTRGPHAGQYVDASLTPREAMALWDAIISSIHVRPNAVRPK